MSSFEGAGATLFRLLTFATNVARGAGVDAWFAFLLASARRYVQ